MDSESMEPWYWRKGPRTNDEYTGHMADGDPLFNPPDGWEPPINYHDSAYLPEAANSGASTPLVNRLDGLQTDPYSGGGGGPGLSSSQQGEKPGHWGGVGSENYGTPLWDNTVCALNVSVTVALCLCLRLHLSPCLCLCLSLTHKNNRAGTLTTTRETARRWTRSQWSLGIGAKDQEQMTNTLVTWQMAILSSTRQTAGSPQ